MEEVRDRILKSWRVAKAPEKKERIAKALNNFIDELCIDAPIIISGSSSEIQNSQLEQELGEQPQKTKTSKQSSQR